ncbi:hypothetical protein NZK35_08735 [Stieleria sp. ICT_E10.1]|uniref:hypothetical protein n=1 Tax=Stieleria sedimenti TaxID=2976331 RepID=UPI0021801905|nr:hypothetical protein [Stieleria sedimenti]MCS7466727.1 hypothetical protein [Stieleria sedimenti]
MNAAEGMNPSTGSPLHACSAINANLAGASESIGILTKTLFPEERLNKTPSVYRVTRCTDGNVNFFD